MAKSYKMYLAGQWRDSKKKIKVLSSYDDRLVGTVASAGPNDYTAAVDAAEKAFAITRQLPCYVRERICRQIADS
ncbi:MAG: aldehyde dehydrogenase, partial [candidate division Zixibacteria bacterium]|nr:aldehyde dehydrogenase [candidate division Zixibacteria bacterium]